MHEVRNPTDETAHRAIAEDAEFTNTVQRYRRELHAHCYRILGSLEDAEETVQETLLRAWRARDSFVHRASVRGWLYRIATNACLDILALRRRRRLPYSFPAAVAAGPEHAPLPESVWVQPYRDHLLDLADSAGSQPETVVLGRETIELAFAAALQQLPPRQRAILVLRDVVGWPAAEVASALGTSVPAVNSGLQRATGTSRSPRRSRHLVAAGRIVRSRPPWT